MAAVESCGQVTLIEQPPSTETHTHPATPQLEEQQKAMVDGR